MQIIIYFFLLLLFLPSNSSSSSSACKSTINPKLCHWILSSFNHSSPSPSSSSSLSKFSIKQSLNHAIKLSNLINHHPHGANGPLSDCALLFDLNVDYLQRIMHELNTHNRAISSSWGESVGRVEALLSGVVTNQQTCYDEITKVNNNNKNNGDDLLSELLLHDHVVNGTHLYSASLGIVTHALKSNNKHHSDFKTRVYGEHLDKSWEPTYTIFQLLHNNSHGFARDRTEESRSSMRIMDVVTVSNFDKDANFTSINEAIEFAPDDSVVEDDGYYVICIKEGYYEEYVNIPKQKKGIMLLGDGIDQTVITGSRNALDGWTTFNSATLAVSGEGFVAMGITFMNTAGRDKYQAVAVRNNADLSTFYKCSFIGYQDTLYAHSMRHFYRECDIYGTVDFIFGNAACVFQNCNLYGQKPLPYQNIVITAQGRSDPNQDTGFSIHNCTIQPTLELAIELLNNNTTTSAYLGRPWHSYSTVVYMQSYMDDFIDPLGWLAWNETDESVDTVYYGEYENYGPGADTSMRVDWEGYELMDDEEAMDFTVYNFTMGDTWLGYANVPFNAGLM